MRATPAYRGGKIALSIAFAAIVVSVGSATYSSSSSAHSHSSGDATINRRDYYRRVDDGDGPTNANYHHRGRDNLDQHRVDDDYERWRRRLVVDGGGRDGDDDAPYHHKGRYDRRRWTYRDSERPMSRRRRPHGRDGSFGGGVDDDGGDSGNLCMGAAAPAIPPPPPSSSSSPNEDAIPSQRQYRNAPRDAEDRRPLRGTGPVPRY
jgi:hypothetical protein